MNSKFKFIWGISVIIKKGNSLLHFYIGKQRVSTIFPETENVFFSKTVDTTIEFNVDKNGIVEGLVFHLGGDKLSAKRLSDGR